MGSATGLGCKQGGSDFGQLAQGPALQPDSANQLEAALAAAIAGLVSTKRKALSRPAPARKSPLGERTLPREEAETHSALAGRTAVVAARCPSVLAGWAAAAATAPPAAHA